MIDKYKFKCYAKLYVIHSVNKRGNYYGKSNHAGYC